MAENHFDVAIIGQGPAGMTAALYASRAGLSTVTFERMGPGGQMTDTDRFDNYPGFSEGVDAFELTFAMSAQANRFGAQSITEEVTALDLQATPKVITTAAGNTFTADAIILALGAVPRPMGIEREQELTGKGVSYCATCDGGFFKGKEVAIVGGGNTAIEDAIYLSRLCPKVHVVHRRNELRADAVYVNPLKELDNIELHLERTVSELKSDENGLVNGAVLTSTVDNATEELNVSAVFVAVGMLPRTDLVKDTGLEMDERGYIVAGESGETNIPGVFVAGDCRTKLLRQVSTAVGDGANAATSAFAFISLHK